MEEKHDWKEHIDRVCYLEMHVEWTTKACFFRRRKISPTGPCGIWEEGQRFYWFWCHLLSRIYVAISNIMSNRRVTVKLTEKNEITKTLDHTAYQNLWATVKAVLRGKFTLNAYIRKNYLKSII